MLKENLDSQKKFLKEQIESYEKDILTINKWYNIQEIKQIMRDKKLKRILK